MDDLPVVEGVPEEAAELFAALLEERPLPLEELRREVTGYIAFVRERKARAPSVDLISAEGLWRSSAALLAVAADGVDEGTRRVIQAAVRYFVVEEDAEGDLASPEGFDDDVLVMNACVRHLERPDLVVPLRSERG